MAVGNDILSKRKWTTALAAATRKATSTTSAELGPMVKGELYVLRSDVDAFFLQGATGVAVTATTGNPIFAKEGIELACDDATSEGYVAVILSSGTGVAYLCRVS